MKRHCRPQAIPIYREPPWWYELRQLLLGLAWTLAGLVVLGGAMVVGGWV